MSIQEFKVASRHDLSPGEMKQVKAGEKDILLARDQDEFFATAAFCSHYGAPLEQGVLNGKRVICPWHHACFDVSNGNQLEPPGCDSLPSFLVEVRGDDIYVNVPEDAPSTRTLNMEKRDQQDKRTFVIAGGGAAAQHAAESLRAEGYQGRILMISLEDTAPYDRVNCSKEYLQGEAPEEWMPLRDHDFYKNHDIEVMTQTRITELDTDSKTITLHNGDTVAYDKALVCTGGKAKKLPIDGMNLENVFTLRSLKDSSRIQEAAKNAKRAVVIGSSFIGMEGAWSLLELGCQVTVVSPEEVPFANKWGNEVGKMLKTLHEKNSVSFHLQSKVKELQGNGKVEQVILDNGKSLEADLVLAGVGVEPATDFIKGLSLAEDGGIQVNEQLYAGKDVYAAGDIAYFPYKNQPVRIEHWRLAGQHGLLAGANMAGKNKAYESVPFFWTAQHGLQMRYVGYVEEYDRMIVDGSIEEQEFMAMYIQDGMVKAALGINRDKDMAALEELIRIDRVPPVKDLEKHQIDLQQHLKDTATTI